MNQYSDLLSELSDFLYPRSPYYGDLKSEHLEFNAQLQDFSQRVNYISGLQTGGKLSSEEAYKQIRILWKQLKMSKKKILIC
ncbi:MULTISPECIES: hypothetical protein [Nostocales]|jgi:arginine deiminase|uniref:Uncharacterized protein n=1 Tax=Dolichospermum flos-aquae UHCC 0037 TaxID=2590026 RepID=A0ACC7S2J0_DOLFA|nr:MULTISPECIES: hypothetical protein [Nostocales]ALB42277.1 hypothetical protein AA650_19075 [Anabaena sp. WA102]MBO1063314.1 hypothetical protein [Anabaena sp. 54]MTJ42246.1 hypothetical protein [Dolichospermum flos-aquae UHCC 0037]OBQ20158.1 MAG: hypothetical protein AN486_07490 [Anabaena sp. AL93]